MRITFIILAIMLTGCAVNPNNHAAKNCNGNGWRELQWESFQACYRAHYNQAVAHNQRQSQAVGAGLSNASRTMTQQPAYSPGIQQHTYTLNGRRYICTTFPATGQTTCR